MVVLYTVGLWITYCLFFDCGCGFDDGVFSYRLCLVVIRFYNAFVVYYALDGY